ncbi:MAG: C10 family peptidase [Candidatus Cloacimonadaceae bacterium]|jgi:hypothetical protein|nr:C10 family peptidase [Candidatus Cloacimonadaceae bacterium]
MKKVICILIALFALTLNAVQISETRAECLAQNLLKANSISRQIGKKTTLKNEDTPLAFVYTLKPTGYLVISAQSELPPLMAYSWDSTYDSKDPVNPLQQILVADLTFRLQWADYSHEDAWQELEKNPQSISMRNEYLMNSTWNQTAPWNRMCPMDPISNTRSVAGCPAIAMGQIINYLKTLNCTRLTNADDYYHSFSGRNYMIDDDFADLRFPSFLSLNDYLDRINMAFNYEQNLSDSLQAALVFACGTALQQIYSSQVSGTLSVNQAFAAYQRFGFARANLLGPDHPNLYVRMMFDLSDGIPVHLAMVTPTQDAGHNVVVDGFNDEGLFHLNFGWGGQYNGWYSLPEQMPYGLTVVEGAVVDLSPTTTVLSLPEQITMSAGESQNIELVNLSDTELTLLDVLYQDGLNADEWQISVDLPITIDAMGVLNLTLSHTIPLREIVHGKIRFVFDQAFLSVPISFSPSSSSQDESQSPAAVHVSTSPNPFSTTCSFHISGAKSDDLELSIYNLKGQVLKRSKQMNWNGRDTQGKICPTGIYLYRIEGTDFHSTGRILKQ